MMAPELAPDPDDYTPPEPTPTRVAQPKPSRRLFQIGQDYLALEELLLESGGEVTPEVEELMAEVQGSLEQKVEGYCSLIKEWEGDAAKWKE